MKNHFLFIIGLALGLTAGACSKKTPVNSAGSASAKGDDDTPDSTEDLTIVVEADKSRITEEENALTARKQDFETERARLDREKTEIAEKLSTLSKKDKTQRDKLENEERRLTDQQKVLRDRSDSFESERTKLEQDKSRLLDRISKMTQTKGGMTIEQREEAIAHREKEVAQREKDVARREAEAGRGLQEVGKLMDEVRSGMASIKNAPVQVVTAAAPAATGGSSGAPASKASVTRLEKTIHTKMDQKGILTDDLSPSAHDLEATAIAAISNKDFAAAQDALSQLGVAVDSITINHSFVQAKMARINRQFDDKKLGAGMDDTRQKKIQSLLAEASDSFSDGRYDRANRKINSIYAVLQPK